MDITLNVYMNSTYLKAELSSKFLNKNLLTVTFTVPAEGLSTIGLIVTNSAATEWPTITIQAAKLELGTVQTLAHQDDFGNWVLNDPPPDKTLELLKCQRYQVVYHFKDIYDSIGRATLQRDALFWYCYLHLSVPVSKTPTIVSEGEFAITFPDETYMSVFDIQLWRLIGNVLVFRFHAKEATSEHIGKSGAFRALTAPAKLIIDANL